MSLGRRSVTSATWAIGASLTRVVVLFVRSVMLARLLPVEVFGIYSLAGSIVGLSVVLPNFGMADAFLHRAPETENETLAAGVHFTLKLIATLTWAGMLVVGGLVFTNGQLRMAILLLTLATAGVELAHTPRVILFRRVEHRRLALLEFASAVLTTLVAVWLAWSGATLWALLATNLVTSILTIVVLFVWRPVWRPRLVWSSPLVRYFLRFGSRSFASDLLLVALDRIDDLWTGLFLGRVPLGLYSRAYTFATYPRTILAAPINLVAGGAYAELKGDRLRLSQAFFRTNAILIRSGFLLGGLLALAAPEFIRFLLGEKWLPMLDAFRLMLVFVLLDPIKGTVAHLFVAVGHPERVAKARFVQLAVLLLGLFSFGLHWGIVGVALAVDVMLIVGMTILLNQAKMHVDFSPKRLFVVPGLALALGIFSASSIIAVSHLNGSAWITGLLKVVAFSLVYGGVLFVLERRQLSELLRILKRLLLNQVT